MSTKLSPNFTMSELCTTSQDIINVPTAAAVTAGRDLAVQVLEVWRAGTETVRPSGALKVNSWYRSPAVNRAVNGSASSDHMKGRAADVKPVDGQLVAAWDSLVTLIRDHWLPVDQAIFYARPKGGGWIHVSHRPANNRGEILINYLDPDGKQKYVPYLSYRGPMIPLTR